MGPALSSPTMGKCAYPGCPKQTRWRVCSTPGVSRRDRSNRFSYRFGDELFGLHVRFVQDRFDVEQKQPYAAFKFVVVFAVLALIIGLIGAALGR